MTDFKSMPFTYWGNVSIMEYIQRRVIVHSIIYYEFNEAVISDYDFDMLCNQLVTFQNELPFADVQKTCYHYCFHDFDGSTGCYLQARLNAYDFEYLRNIAGHVLLSYRKEKENKNVGKKRNKE